MPNNTVKPLRLEWRPISLDSTRQIFGSSDVSRELIMRDETRVTPFTFAADTFDTVRILDTVVSALTTKCIYDILKL